MENFRLRVFRAVTRSLNFRIAAEELLLTQPAVSQQIKALETELATPLFSRAGGRVALTPAGSALVPYADQLKKLSDEARAAVNAAAGYTAGELSVGASQTIGQYLLPRLIAGFLAQHPGVSLSVVGGNTQSVLDELRAARIHLALIEGPALGHDVAVTPFMQDHMVCVVPADHAWANQEIALTDLRDATLLMREQGSGSRRVVEEALETALAAAGLQLRDLLRGLTFDSTEGLLSAVEAGLGIAFVSRWAVRNQLALDTLKLVHVRGLSLVRMFSIATPAGPDPGGAAGAFRRFVLERAESLAPRPTGRAGPRPV
jgi:DNA-binding transcriptional LysR family regulator